MCPMCITATLLIVGSNLTTQLLKHWLTRPNFGIDPERVVAGNSLPSGHATVAASVSIMSCSVAMAARDAFPRGSSTTRVSGES